MANWSGGSVTFQKMRMRVVCHMYPVSNMYFQVFIFPFWHVPWVSSNHSIGCSKNELQKTSDMICEFCWTYRSEYRQRRATWKITLDKKLQATGLECFRYLSTCAFWSRLVESPFEQAQFDVEIEFCVGKYVVQCGTDFTQVNRRWFSCHPIHAITTVNFGKNSGSLQTKICRTKYLIFFSFYSCGKIVAFSTHAGLSGIWPLT